MAAPGLRNVSGPRQNTLQDVPVVRHDIRGGVPAFRQTIRTLQHRDGRIAVFTVNDVPVTPHANAATRISSSHIVRLFDSQPPVHVEHRYMVDLFIRDQDLYLVAFRRRRITVEQIAAGAGEDDGWGRWFCFDEMVGVVPNFLNALPMGLTSSHGDPRPGGEDVLVSMLYAMAAFETEAGQAGAMTNQVKRAVWNAMVVYYETRRLRSLLSFVYEGIRMRLPPRPLPQRHWMLIHVWGNMSEEVLKERIRRTLALENVLPAWYIEHYELGTMNQGIFYR